MGVDVEVLRPQVAEEDSKSCDLPGREVETDAAARPGDVSGCGFAERVDEPRGLDVPRKVEGDRCVCAFGFEQPNFEVFDDLADARDVRVSDEFEEVTSSIGEGRMRTPKDATAQCQEFEGCRRSEGGESEVNRGLAIPVVSVPRIAREQDFVESVVARQCERVLRRDEEQTGSVPFRGDEFVMNDRVGDPLVALRTREPMALWLPVEPLAVRLDVHDREWRVHAPSLHAPRKSDGEANAAEDSFRQLGGEADRELPFHGGKFTFESPLQRAGCAVGTDDLRRDDEGVEKLRDLGGAGGPPPGRKSNRGREQVLALRSEKGECAV